MGDNGAGDDRKDLLISMKDGKVELSLNGQGGLLSEKSKTKLWILD